MYRESIPYLPHLVLQYIFDFLAFHGLIYIFIILSNLLKLCWSYGYGFDLSATVCVPIFSFDRCKRLARSLKVLPPAAVKLLIFEKAFRWRVNITNNKKFPHNMDNTNTQTSSYLLSKDPDITNICPKEKRVLSDRNYSLSSQHI